MRTSAELSQKLTRSSHAVQAVANTSVDDLHYSYDDVGNVTLA